MVLGFLNNPWELMIVALLALLFFGNRLPSVMRSLGRGVTEFKKGVEGITDDDDLDKPRRSDRVAHDEPKAVNHEPARVEEPQPVKDTAANKTA